MPREAVHLELAQSAFEGLHRALERLRATSKTVSVDREALATLLRDHAALLAYHRKAVTG